MKIGLVLDSDLNVHGGVQEYVRGLYDYVVREGHQGVIVASSMPSHDDRKRRIEVLGHSVEIPFVEGRSSTPLTWSPFGAIRAFLDRESFDLLHFQGPFGLLSLQLLLQARTINVVTFHVYKEWKFYRSLMRVLSPLTRAFTRRIHGLIAVSQAARSYAERAFPGRYHIIPNGIDLQRFRHRGKSIADFRDGKSNILFVGRLDRRKGLVCLLQAFKRLVVRNPDVRLLVVGEGPEKKEAQRFIQKHAVEGVVFLGAVPRQILPDYYRTADIFCSPALEKESFGVVLLEAMATGLPLVVFANTGYEELLQNVHCSLVRPGDIDGLAESLEMLVRNEDLRDLYTESGRREVSKYSWECVGKTILDFYETLVGQQARC